MKKMKKSKAFAVTLFTMSFLLTAPNYSSVVGAAPDTRVKGVIKAVDLDAHTVTVTPRNGQDVTLRTNERTVITRNGEPVRLQDLQVGDKVGASYDSENLLASKIEAKGTERVSLARVGGTIVAVNLEASSITIDPASEGEPVRLLVTRNTSITLDDRPARLSDLDTGFRAAAVYNADTHEALRIDAESLSECTLQRVAGVIARVHLETSTLVVEPTGGGENVTLNVTPRTEITLNDRPARLSDLQPGMRVGASFCRETQDAKTIAATSGGGDECTLLRVAGAIARVDVEAQTLTIEPSSGGERVTLNIIPRTEITLNGRPARLSDLRAGMRVTAKFCRETLNAATIKATSR